MFANCDFTMEKRLNNFFWSSQKKSMNLKTEFANVVSFGIAWLTIFNLWCVWYGDRSWMSLNCVAVVFQCSYDIFLYHSHDSVLHHCFVLMLGYLLTFELLEEEFMMLSVPLLLTEISTVFLVLRSWMINLELSESRMYVLNNVVFVASFIFFRIYLFYVMLLGNVEVHEVMVRHTSGLDRLIVYGGLFGLSALNYYWLVLILKKMFGRLQGGSNYHRDFLCYTLNYYTLLYYYLMEDLKPVTTIYFVSSTSFMLIYTCCRGSVLYLNECFFEMYDSNLVVLPVLFDVILVAFESSIGKSMMLLVLSWYLFMVYLLRPFGGWNQIFLWMFFLVEIIILHSKENGDVPEGSQN